jgi:hypothetical protein
MVRGGICEEDVCAIYAECMIQRGISDKSM